MIYAILSDIHANESAFRHVLADAKSKGADRLICLGDVVGYGPLPEESANLVRAACSVVLAGNHDDAVSGRLDAKDFINLAGDAIQRHRETLSVTNLKWLASLPYTYAGDGFIASHGDFTDSKKFFYIEDEADAKVNFKATAAQLMFVGHTHVPQLFVTGSSGHIYKMPPTDFAVEKGKRYIVNPGSVGYPRVSNGVCKSSYVLYNSALREVSFQFIPFAVASVMQRGHNPLQPTALPERAPPAIRKRILIPAILCLSALVGFAVFFLTPKTQIVEVKNEVIEVQEDARLLIRHDTLALTDDRRRFLPNLKLVRGSAPVLLKAVFKGKGGVVLGSASIPVKHSRTKAISIPDGSEQADISLLKLNPQDAPRILEYKPAFRH